MISVGWSGRLISVGVGWKNNFCGSLVEELFLCNAIFSWTIFGKMFFLRTLSL